MANFRSAGVWWCRTVLTVLAVGLAGRAAESAVTDKAKAREALRALRSAVENDVRAREKTATVLPPRPPKTITPPTIDAAAIDAMLEKSLAAGKTPLAPMTTDEEFLRRAHLDVTGKLPTPEQVREFVRFSAKDKRAKLIEYLLNSPDYAGNWGRYWRDVIQFHATNPNAGQVNYGELEHWLTEQFARNTPWDEVARGLITATGRNDENGSVGFTLAHDAQAVEMAGEVSRIFLGVQIQCAQCHDHPNDSWKRQQFHELAAFFAGAKVKRVTKPGPGQGPPVFEIEMGKPRYTMPDKQEPQKQIAIDPKFFLDRTTERLPRGLTAAQRHELVASYITGQDNPWFARAFVNRVWYVLMGEGFYNPVDDLGPARTAHAPELIDALASQWQKGGYDVRWLFKTILNTRAYQREGRATNTAAGRTPFASNCPSRLRSDQILDALSQALNLPFNNPLGNKGKEKGKDGEPAKVVKQVAAKNGGPKGGPRNQFNAIFGIDPSTPNDDVVGTIPQALFLMNSPQINRAIQLGKNTVLGEVLATNPNNRAALDALYLRVLARRPNLKEVHTCGRYLEHVGDRREAFEDILWSLINSTEFVSRR